MFFWFFFLGGMGWDWCALYKKGWVTLIPVIANILPILPSRMNSRFIHSRKVKLVFLFIIPLCFASARWMVRASIGEESWSNKDTLSLCLSCKPTAAGNKNPSKTVLPPRSPEFAGDRLSWANGSESEDKKCPQNAAGCTQFFWETDEEELQENLRQLSRVSAYMVKSVPKLYLPSWIINSVFQIVSKFSPKLATS